MTRSNEERLGMPQVAPPPNIRKNTSSLEFVVPTEFVELPSKGQFYPPSHPLCNKDVIEIKHMTTKEEDILTSMTLIKKGIAVDRMLQNIIVDPSISVEDLLIGDKNALLMAARIHGYGAEYQTTITCPKCYTEVEYSFDLGNLQPKILTEERLEKYNVQKTERGTFIFNLPGTNFNVEIKLINGHDEKRISAAAEHKKKLNLTETLTSDFLRAIIVSVNDIEDQGEINAFINTLPAKYARKIKSITSEIAPSVDMKHTFCCQICTYEGSMEVPLNASFFWPKS